MGQLSKRQTRANKSVPSNYITEDIPLSIQEAKDLNLAGKYARFYFTGDTLIDLETNQQKKCTFVPNSPSQLPRQINDLFGVQNAKVHLGTIAVFSFIGTQKVKI